MIDVDKIKNLKAPEAAPTQPVEPEESTFDKILSGAKSAGKEAGETAATGGAKLLSGLTYGAAKNVGPAADALKDKAMESLGVKTKSGKDLGQMYDEYKKAYEDMYARSPVVGQTAEMVGAALSPINEIAAPVGAMVKGTGALAGIGRNAAVGSALGATAGIGGTEAQPTLGETAKEMGKNALAGGTIGGAVGGAIAGVPEAINATGRGLGQFLEKFPAGQKAMAAYRHGTEGGSVLNPILENGRNEVEKKTSDAAQDLESRISGANGVINNAYNKVLPTGTTISNPDSSTIQSVVELQNSLGKISGTDKLQTALSKFKSGTISPRELKDLQMSLRTKAGQVSQNDPFLADQIKNTLDSTTQELNKIPGYSEVNSLYKEGREIPEGMISGVPKEQNETLVGNMRKPTQKTFEEAKSMMSNAYEPGQNGPGTEARGQLKEFGDNLRDFTQNVKNMPDELAEKLGVDKKLISENINPDDIMNKIAETGKTFQASKAASNKPWTPSGLGSWSGSALGKWNGPAELGQSMSKASVPALHTAADALKSNNGTTYLGGALKDALNENNNPARTAALFSIAQSPQARELLKNSSNEDEANPWKNNY